MTQHQHREHRPVWPLAMLAAIVATTSLVVGGAIVRQQDAAEDALRQSLAHQAQQANLADFTRTDHVDARVLSVESTLHTYQVRFDAAGEAFAAQIAAAPAGVDLLTSKMALDSLRQNTAPNLLAYANALRQYAEFSADLKVLVDAYNAEQARIAAEQAAADALAAEQEGSGTETWSDDSEGGTEAYSAPEPEPESSGGVDYTLWVYAVGQDQALVDACAGPVEWWTEVFVEHWSCGGSSFPGWIGAIIDVPGYGTYRVNGVAWDAYAFSGPAYQTCLNGNPSTTVWYTMERI